MHRWHLVLMQDTALLLLGGIKSDAPRKSLTRLALSEARQYGAIHPWRHFSALSLDKA